MITVVIHNKTKRILFTYPDLTLVVSDHVVKDDIEYIVVKRIVRVETNTIDVFVVEAD